MPLSIGGRALAVLSELAAAGGEMVGKDELMERVWSGAVVEDNALQAQVSQLRKIMGKEAARLVAVHGRGYRLAVDIVSRVPSSLAVLPFANLTGDPGMAYLGEGMAEELLVILSRAPGLRVPARTSSFAYRGRDTDVRTIARDLGVEAVLEGSVRAAGERIRVTAQLIEAETGFHLWSENYDRRFGDLLALQDEIAAAIARALKAQIGLEQQRTPEFEAYHLYLRARALCEGHGESDLRIALGLLDRAIVRDPEFALAHAQRGYCIHLGIMHGVFGSKRHDRVADDAVRALELDPQDSRIHALDGLVRASRCDWCGARDAYSPGLSFNDPDPGVHSNFGYYVLAPLGRSQDAITQCEHARSAAPADPGIAAMCAVLRWLLRGDFVAAAQGLDRAVELGFPADDLTVGYTRALIALMRGDVVSAVAAMAATTPPTWRELGVTSVIERTFCALVFQADRAAAASALKAVLDSAREADRFDRLAILTAYGLPWLVLLGALDEAYEVAGAIIDSLRRTGYFPPVVVIAIWSPFMRAFRDDPRFDEFVRALNMFEYWERHGPPDGYDLVEGKLNAR